MKKIAIAAYIWCLAFAGISFAQVPDGERMSPELSRRIQNIDAAAQMERGEVVRPSYGTLIINTVMPNIVFNPDDVSGNPVAEVEVRTAPNGKIMGRKLTKSSGNKAWDEAVIKALDKTDTLPRDLDGTLPAVMVLGFKPREDSVQKSISEIKSQKCLPPTYPAMSRRNGEQGNVLVRSKIGVDGEAINPEILVSSGYERLDRSALNWVKTCRFIPVRVDGRIVEGYVNIPTKFVLSDSFGMSEIYSIKNKKLIFEKVEGNLNINYSSSGDVIMVGCRLGRIPMLAHQSLISFQKYLSKAFVDELTNAERFSSEGKLLNIAIKSVELSTLGKGVWEVELLVYLDDSNKVVVKTVLPFNQSVPTGGPCDNAKYVLPELASEIIKAVFTDSRVLSIVN